MALARCHPLQLRTIHEQSQECSPGAATGAAGDADDDVAAVKQPIDVTEAMTEASMAAAEAALSSWPPVSRRRSLAQVKRMVDRFSEPVVPDHSMLSVEPSPMKFGASPRRP